MSRKTEVEDDFSCLALIIQFVFCSVVAANFVLLWRRDDSGVILAVDKTAYVPKGMDTQRMKVEVVNAALFASLFKFVLSSVRVAPRPASRGHPRIKAQLNIPQALQPLKCKQISA